MTLQSEIEVSKHWRDVWLPKLGETLELGQGIWVQGNKGSFYLERVEQGWLKLSSEAPVREEEAKAPHWGNAMWKEFHEMAWVGTMDEEYLTSFTLRIPAICACRAHWKEVLTNHPFPSHDFFLWSVIVHNAINKRLGKPLFSYSSAEELYATTH